LQFAGVRGLEWVIIIGLVVAVFFGAKKIPELARSFGKATTEFEKARFEAKRELEQLKSSSPNGSSNSSSSRTRLEEVARSLDIEIASKTDEQLRTEIQKQLHDN
jgi:sec-independent protein translocase protein TatA